MKTLTCVIKYPRCPKCKTNEHMDYSAGEETGYCTKCGNEYQVQLVVKR
jgi:tRNA(Ile2) C34 agmatinyltransferase TiaS